MVRNYSLEQKFKITDENARDIKNIKVLISAKEEGVENSNMESMFKDFAAGFVDYLHNENQMESDDGWNNMETLFSDYSESDCKRKGMRGFFR